MRTSGSSISGIGLWLEEARCPLYAAQQPGRFEKLNPKLDDSRSSSSAEADSLLAYGFCIDSEDELPAASLSASDALRTPKSPSDWT